jgi:hypothetical protein
MERRKAAAAVKGTANAPLRLRSKRFFAKG